MTHASRRFTAVQFLVLFFVASIARAETKSVTIFFTSNTRGETKTCGCGELALGGIGRRATVIRDETRPKLLLDAGDTFYSDTEFPKHVLPSMHSAARMLARAYRNLKYDAVLLGEMDALLPKKLQSTLPLLSDGGAPKLITRGGVGFVLIGISNPLSDAEIVRLNSTIASEKAKKRIVVVLIHLTESARERALTNLINADLIFLGHTGEAMKEPRIQNGALVIEGGDRGQYVAKLVVHVSDAAAAFGLKNEVERDLLEAELKYVAAELKPWRNELPNNEKLKLDIAALREKEVAVQHQLQQLPAPTSNYYSYELVPLRQSISPAVLP